MEDMSEVKKDAEEAEVKEKDKEEKSIVKEKDKE